MFGKNLKIPVNQLSINMIKFIKKVPNDPIPELVDHNIFTKNAWIAPNGDFYGMEGAFHDIAATYIAVFVLHKDETVLNHGVFFKDSFHSYLLRNGWVCVKNSSWMYSKKDVEAFKHNKVFNPNVSAYKYHSELTSRQKETLFDYCESFGFNYEELFGNIQKSD